MAAERAPSRRKQCIFRRAFQRFPFGKCERKSRTNSSYEVLSKDSTQQTVEKWSPADPGVSSFGSPHSLTLEGMEPKPCGRTEQEDPLNSCLAMCEDTESTPDSSIPHMDHPVGYRSDSMHLHQNTVGLEDLASQSPPEEEGPVHVALPPSPSISSMETDVEVDPETGERALE